ncbi:MAG: hypothetical protein AB1720_06510 [Pseudomonadota bacterium]
MTIKQTGWVLAATAMLALAPAGAEVLAPYGTATCTRCRRCTPFST